MLSLLLISINSTHIQLFSHLAVDQLIHLHLIPVLDMRLSLGQPPGAGDVHEEENHHGDDGPAAGHGDSAGAGPNTRLPTCVVAITAV